MKSIAPKPPTDERLLGFARRMRSDSTDAEIKLWWLLRNRKLAGFKFRRQVPTGIRVLRYWDNDILKNTAAVKEQIYRELTSGDPQQAELSPTSPHPNPLPGGEGVSRGEIVR